MVKQILHGNMNSYFYVDSIATMLTANPDKASQHNAWCHKITSFPVQKIFWLSISFKMTSQNAETIKNTYISRNNANVPWHSGKTNMIYGNLETVSHLTQRNKIVKISKKSANKDSLCSGIQTYFSWNNNYLSIILCFSNIPHGSKIIGILVMSVMKTADVRKLFLAIFERTYDGLYIYYFFVAAAYLYQK